jgi:hypothetical protein
LLLHKSPLINNLDSKCYIVFVSLYLIFVFLQDRKLQGLLVCVRVKYVLTKKFRLIHFHAMIKSQVSRLRVILPSLTPCPHNRSEPCNTLATVSHSSEPSSYQPSLATFHPNGQAIPATPSLALTWQHHSLLPKPVTHREAS